MGPLMSQPTNVPNRVQISQYADMMIGRVGAFWRAHKNSTLIAAPLAVALRLLFPLAFAILAASGILALTASRNNFFGVMRFTLPLGAMNFLGAYATGWNLILGTILLSWRFPRFSCSSSREPAAVRPRGDPRAEGKKSQW
jgi:hypothetical protein